MGIGGAPAWSRRGYEAARAGESGGDSDLVRFVETLAFIERAATGPRGASSDDVEALVTEALKILVARGIKPRRSRVSAMYEDLHRAAAAFHGRAGSAALRVWHTLLLGECGAEVDALPAEDSRLAVREIARRRMRSGAVAGVRALVGARRLPEHGSLEELRALRLAGAHFEALSMADAMRRAGGVVDGSRLAWEMACNRTHLSAETTPVIEFLRGSEGPSPERSAWLALYEFAAPRKRAAERVEGIAALEVDEPVADVLAVLRACHDQTTPVHSRLHHAGLALVQPAGGESDAEAELLLLASLARWTFQLKKHAMTGVIVGAYRDLSLALSGGQSEDVLGFVSDIQDALDRRPARSGTVDIDDDGSWAHRAGGTAAMIAEIATQLGVSRTRQLFASGERAKRLQRDERAALMGTLVRRVDGLKGPFLKLAQQLSYIGLDLDPETDARLRALQDQSSSVPFDGIERVVREELGKLPRALFAEFSEAPIGVGSVGQVHAARLHDGTEVAV
ncbi:MAG: AarF/ABC1/UbiB kinase family protein, partial [Myxococcales bacterium]|nr:AarF/ABC1/UbiB kinase family protein [Myxococcales bacterium]